MFIQDGLSCCGIREITDLRGSRGPIAAMNSFIAQVYSIEVYGYNKDQRSRWRYAIFSGTGRSRYGIKFAAFIKENKLGEVIETGFNVNPNSGNRLKVWVWTVDHTAVKAWGKAHGQTIEV